jgi:type I restriction enzyme S subunit
MVVTTTYDKKNKHTVLKGDLIFTPSSETIDDIGISALVNEEMFNTSFSYHVLRCSFIQDINHSFKKYLTNNTLSLSQFSCKARGTTSQTLSRDDFKTLYIPLPPLTEQKSIADFLDKATSKIDTTIEKQTKLIELLKEKRQAVISHAVTKGLDPNVPMEDSGVEWLGDIPSEWVVSPLRYVGKLQNGISKGSEYFGLGYPFINYGDVYNNMCIPFKVQGLANSTVEDQRTYSVKKGDIFFTRTSETISDIGMASTCLQTIDKATFSWFTIRFRQFNYILNENFSKYYFRTGHAQSFFEERLNLVTRASLGQDVLKQLPILQPVLSEQVQIADYLDKKTAQEEQTTFATCIVDKSQPY